MFYSWKETESLKKKSKGVDEMKIAVFSDLHGNIFALEAVLKVIVQAQANEIVCLGDLVGYHPFPNEVVERIRRLAIPTIMGNYDQGVGFDLDDCGCAYRSQEERERGHLSFAWTRRVVTQEHKQFLTQLLPRYEIEFGEHRLLFVHGSPRRINEYLFPDRPEESFLHMMEKEKAQVLVCGHTHIPFCRRIQHLLVINDGSVGLPKDGDWRACLCLIEIGEEITVHFERIPYPRELLLHEYEKYPELPRFL